MLASDCIDCIEVWLLTLQGVLGLRLSQYTIWVSSLLFSCPYKLILGFQGLWTSELVWLHVVEEYTVMFLVTEVGVVSLYSYIHCFELAKAYFWLKKVFQLAPKLRIHQCYSTELCHKTKTPYTSRWFHFTRRNSSWSIKTLKHFLKNHATFMHFNCNISQFE